MTIHSPHHNPDRGRAEVSSLDLFHRILRHDLMSFVRTSFHTLEPGTSFADNWHIHVITHALERVASGQCKRLIINVPPRSMKSITVTVAFSAWLLGRNPAKRIMAISHANDLSFKLGADTRTLMESRWFAEAFPECRIAGATRSKINTSGRGYRMAGSVNSGILGHGADLIIVDDPINGLDAALSEAERRRTKEFWDGTLSTRLNDKRTGQVVMVMQRLHEDDLVGHVLKQDDWEVIAIPAIAEEDQCFDMGLYGSYHRKCGDLLHPEREPQEVLDRLRRTLGSMNFSAQYQQKPIPAGGNVIHREWLRYYEEVPDAFERVITSWDTASTIGEASDWSVGTVWGAIGTDYYLIDLIRGQWEAPDLRRKIIETKQRHDANATLIEDTELGRSLVQDINRTGAMRATLKRPRFDKLARLLAQAARFEAGQVHLPRQAPWLTAYLNELLAFPSGKHDDQVDSTSQALHYLTTRTPVVRTRPVGKIARRR